MLAHHKEAQVLCYADATIRTETQNDAILDFVRDWKARTGKVPGELVFGSRFTVSANLAELDALGIDSIMLHRGQAALIRRVHSLDRSA